jgi:hypothetical protein
MTHQCLPFAVTGARFSIAREFAESDAANVDPDDPAVCVELSAISGPAR